MKKLNAILFKKDGSETAKFRELVCEKFSRTNLSDTQEFCGVWGEIHFNREECLSAISSSINRIINSDKIEIYFGCCEKDYNDIMSFVDASNCEINRLHCNEIFDL